MRLRNWIQTAFVMGQIDSSRDCRLNLLVIILQSLELTGAKPFLICMPGARSLNNAVPCPKASVLKWNTKN